MTLSDGRYFQITAAGVREEDELRVIVMVLRDVTRERQMDEMKTRFFSTVSHEFRTPLTPILGFTKLIRKSLNRSILPLLPPDEQNVQRAANRIDQNAGIIIDQVTRLSKLVEDVLFLADLDAGRLKWKSKEVDIGQLLSTLTDEIRPAAQEKGLGLHTDWPADLPVVIGDANRLTRATRNLLDNAVKFTESGTVSVLAAHYGGQDQDVPFGLHIPNELAGPSLLVAVSDTGPGISPEAQQTLFERFGQGLRDLLTDKPSGTGLGLALSKEIINHHGGLIWVETEEDKGSTFAFALPLAQQDIELELWGEKISLPETAPTILVVDDEPAVRELLYYVLLRAGYRTLMAVDGPTALNMARYHKPDLIILDIMIPGISGLDVTSVLKADAATKQIPIIILSIIADEKKAAELGASACFSKPFDQKELIDTIAGLIHHP
jgi:signal transduction histidine kinase